MSAPPTPARWTTPVLFAVFGAGLYAAAWLAIDRLGAGGGPGRLRGVVWPFNSLPVVSTLGGLSGAIVGRVVLARRVFRLAEAADPVETSREDESAPDSDEFALPDLPAFANPVAVSRRSSERVGDVTAVVFDLTVEEPSGEDGTVHVTRTVVLLQADELPPFDLRPRRPGDRILAWAGAEGLRFDAAAAGTAKDAAVVDRFAAAYRLTTVSPDAMLSGMVEEGDDDAARRVFILGTMRVVVRRADWAVQSQGGHLASWEAADRWSPPRRGLGPKRRARLAADAVALRAALLAAHRGTPEDQVVPAPTGAVSSARQAARLQWALRGGFLGGLAGLVFGWMLSVAVFFGQPAGQRALAGGLIVAWLASILLGAALGAAVGRLLAPRRPVRPRPAAPDPRREKVVGCGVLAGAAGGFFGGAIVGVVLGEVVGLEIDDMQERALLFFGGALVGLFTGPIVLGKATDFVYRQWTGTRD